MKKLFVIALALALTAGAAYANYCARDYVPAATLLVPYAVVDLDATGLAPDVNGYTTILSVTNVSSEAQIIHVTVWSPLSNAVVDFDEVLTGYDVWTINFADLLTGHFDAFDTGTGYLDPDYPVDAWGPTENCENAIIDDPEDIDGANLLGCAFPYGYNPSYGAGIIAALKADIHSAIGQVQDCVSGVPGDPPWLTTIVDDPMFFYVTIDVVRACNQEFPDGGTYFENRYPTGDNVLIGEQYWLNRTANYSEAIPVVHIEWDDDVFFQNSIGNFRPTFYGLAVGGDAEDYDGTEPLATAFAFRYLNDFGASTSLVVWKNNEELSSTWRVDAELPYVYFAWDEDEQSKARTEGPSGFDRPEPNVIPWETQDAPLNVANWNGLMPGNGWMLLIFDPSFPLESDYEAWVGVRYKFGSYSAALEAATMANYWCFRDQILPFGLGIDYDYDAYWWD